VRGGAWSGEAFAARPAYRFGDMPELHSFTVGFRCARDAGAKKLKRWKALDHGS